MINIQELTEDLENYQRASKELQEATELVSLVGRKGYSDGKWYKYPNLEFQVAFQDSCGSKNYHKSQALNREINNSILLNWDKMVEEALQVLTTKSENAQTVFDKYTVKDIT